MARSNGKVKSPSKFISLAKLEDLMLNNCIGNTGQEYCQEEIQSLIYLKQTQEDERQQLEPYEREEQPENTMINTTIEMKAHTMNVTTYKASVLAVGIPVSETIIHTCLNELQTELQSYLDLGYQLGSITKETRTILTSIEELF